MKATELNRRFFQSTRGRIVSLLRKTSRTVNDLAEALDLTDNAVRAHLTTLERDGLVHQVGVERGVRKPNYTYGLTSEGEHLFPKAYGPLLCQLLHVMADRMPANDVEKILRETGHRIAAENMPNAALKDVRGRTHHAVRVLGELGGMAEVEEEDGKLTIRGISCPIKDAVAASPEACTLAETLLTEVIGAPVHERCDKGDNPRCCFQIDAP
jgi:predicted ArsR family transcriptional regulator